jgi:hypothetical protein
MNTTLNRLIELKKFIDNNPKFKSTDWHNVTICDYQTISMLKKHNIVKNMGVSSRPYWKWDSFIPNIKMAERVELEKQKYFYPNKVKAEVKVEVKQEFSDVLFGLEINLNDNISFIVQRSNAKVFRKDNGTVVDFDNINVFKSVLSLLK